MTSEFKEDQLIDYLPLYYKRLFPLTQFYRWLSYGDRLLFLNREFSFTLLDEIYLRYLSFGTIDQLRSQLVRKIPVKIDIGAIYPDRPNNRGAKPKQREIVFDIDMSDYDDVRSCCSGANVCTKCWKFMVIACRILDTAIREDFGYKHLLWVFSGRRGIHCWVCDQHARLRPNQARDAIVQYLSVNSRGSLSVKKAYLPWDIHPSIARSIKIIDKYFMDVLVEQDILGDDAKVDHFLLCLTDPTRNAVKEAFSKHKTSVDRWKAFVATVKDLLHKRTLPRNLSNLVEEMKLHFCYPRLDAGVTRAMNHLLKAPFSVHPKCGKISIPFNPKMVDSFDPSTVPTITILVEEINEYDEKTQELENSLLEVDSQTTPVKAKIKDYKKTSLLRAVTIFEDFLRGMEQARKRGHGECSEKVSMDF